MTYQVLARKWRPKTFAELVGQEHVVRALVNGLDNDRVHHAFLFTGTRGVGKTTIARIFAKALNCEQGVSSLPCGQCANCQELSEGRFLDLIEVDAASRTKVEDTRELLENVMYAPTRGRFKIYLIDEVHMLSTHSFNALLKTLEEPPQHVKFLLATTDPQKLPVTILSRCLQFNLKRLPVAMITQYLTKLVADENVSAENEALGLIAIAADGSMRDALSLLDQAIGYGGGKLLSVDVRGMLGTVDRDCIAGLIESLLANDAGLLWQRIENLAQYTPDYASLLRDLAACFHAVAIAQMIPNAASCEQLKTAVAQRLKDQASPEDVQVYYQIAVQGRRDIDLAPDQRLGFEMAMLRMLAFQPGREQVGEPMGPPTDHQQAGTPPSARAAAKAVPAAVNYDQKSAGIGQVADIDKVADIDQDQQPQDRVSSGLVADDDWEGLISRLQLKGTAAVLANNSVLKRDAQGRFRLLLKPQQEHLKTASAEQRIREALARFYGKDVQVVFELADAGSDSPAGRQIQAEDQRKRSAQESINSDPVVAALKSKFGATIVPNSLKSLK